MGWGASLAHLTAGAFTGFVYAGSLCLIFSLPRFRPPSPTPLVQACPCQWSDPPPQPHQGQRWLGLRRPSLRTPGPGVWTPVRGGTGRARREGLAPCSGQWRLGCGARRPRGWCEERVWGGTSEPYFFPPTKLLLLGWGLGLWEPAPSPSPGAAPRPPPSLGTEPRKGE